MEVLANTEYQDVYRIVDGVLLIVNKFKRIIYDEDKYFRVSFSKAKLKSYNKGCQKWLKVLKEDYYDAYSNITVPNGTVLYQDYPIKLSNVYKYEVKTTGTELDKILPPVSRFGGTGRAKKKQSVVEQLKRFFERFFGIGGTTFTADKTVQAGE